MLIGRRRLLVTSLALLTGACARPTPAQLPAPTRAPPADVDRWKQEARSILSDVLQTLRTFDDFQAFRVSTASGSAGRLPSELTWDAPTSTAWDEATHVSRGVHGRADQLFRVVTNARLDTTQWRLRRQLADATHELLDLGDALAAYRERVDALPPGDASGALSQLETAWKRWDLAAARWGVDRAESIACGSG